MENADVPPVGLSFDQIGGCKFSVPFEFQLTNQETSITMRKQGGVLPSGRVKH